MSRTPLRGINHVGVTVPDIEAATTFLIDALGAQVIYESHSASQPPAGSPDLDRSLNLATGTRLIAARMIQIGNGPDIELFQLQADEQREAARPSDFGLQHLAVYADDIEEAVRRFEAAGGSMFSQPSEILFPKEQGEGNLFCYGQTPWGMMIEFITFPSAMSYENDTPLRRWHSNSCTEQKEDEMILTNEGLIRQVYAAAEAKDLRPDTFVSLFADDGYFLDMASGSRWVGKDLGQPVQGFASIFPDMHRELLNFYSTDDDVVVVELRLQGTHKGDFPVQSGVLPPTNKPFDVPCCDVFHLVDSKVKAFHCYNMKSIWLDQLGALDNLSAALKQ